MWIDTLGEFSDAQALTATAPSTNVINLQSDRDVGPGRPLYVCITQDTVADDGDANETYVVDLETDDNEGFASATTIATITIVAGSPAGTKHTFYVPFTNEQFLRLNYTLGGTTPSVTVNAWVTDQEPQSWVSYPDAEN